MINVGIIGLRQLPFRSLQVIIRQSSYNVKLYSNWQRSKTNHMFITYLPAYLPTYPLKSSFQIWWSTVDRLSLAVCMPCLSTSSPLCSFLYPHVVSSIPLDSHCSARRVRGHDPQSSNYYITRTPTCLLCHYATVFYGGEIHIVFFQVMTSYILVEYQFFAVSAAFVFGVPKGGDSLFLRKRYPSSTHRQKHNSYILLENTLYVPPV